MLSLLFWIGVGYCGMILVVLVGRNGIYLNRYKDDLLGSQEPLPPPCKPHQRPKLRLVGK